MSLMGTSYGTPSLVGCLRLQARVIRALILRETKTLYGDQHLGFLWAFIEPLILLGPLFIIFKGSGIEKSLPFGMTIPGFILTGEGAWYLFLSSVIKLVPAVRSNRALLTFPQVTPLDCLVARGLLNGMVKLTTFFVLVMIFRIFNIIGPIYSYALLIQGLLTGWAFGFGLGLLWASLIIEFPSTEHFIAGLMRLLIFVSGVFFTIDMVPLEFKRFFLLNPMLHFVEITRRSFCPAYTHNGITILYPFTVAVVLIFLGLVMERVMRPRIERL